MNLCERAIVLAAGVSKRLRPLTNNMPKTLLPLNDRETIFSRALKILNKNGIRELYIIVGYRGSKILESIENIMDDFNFDIIDIIYNSYYSSRNNIWSYYLARNAMDDDFILLNSDVVFHEEILKKILNVEHSVLAVDDIKQLGMEEMKVIMDNNGKVLDISKEIDPKKAHGEYIGLAKILSDDSLKILKAVEDLFKSNRYDVFYEEAIRLAINSYGLDIYGISTDGFPWIEVDTLDDYIKLLTEIYKKL